MNESPRERENLSVGSFPPLLLDGLELLLRPGIPSWAQDGGTNNQLSIPSDTRGRRKASTEVIRVLVADSQRLFGESLAFMLSNQTDFEIGPEVPVMGCETIRAAKRFEPAVALVDFQMPDMKGPQIARELIGLRKGIKVMLLSWFHSAVDIEESLDAGAVGFLTKGLTVAQVAEGIRRAKAGESPVYLQELEELFGRLSTRADDAARALQQLKTLSRRELEVLTLLGLDRSAKEVAEDLSLSLPTIRAYIRSMLKKTNTLSTQEVLVKARFCGLLRT